MARVDRKEAMRQRKRMEAEEEFRRQVKRESAYYGMTQGDLARAVPMAPSSLSVKLADPGNFKVWELQRIAEILKLPGTVILPVLGMEVSA